MPHTTNRYGRVARPDALDDGRSESLGRPARPEQFEHPEGGYRYPEAPVASYAPTKRHPHGREARVFDIVEGVTKVGSYGEIPFIGQVVALLPKTGRAEVALFERPADKARRFPHMALQNVAARVIECDLQPLEQLKLRSRATRAVAPYLKAARGPS
jgi:hypothetical protein